MDTYHEATEAKERWYHLKKSNNTVPTVAQWVKNLTSIHKDEGSIPGLTQVKDLELSQASAQVYRCGSDPV